MELVWGIYYAALKDGSWMVDQYVRNDSLERRGKILTKHCFSYCNFDERLRSLCLFSYFYGLACFVVFSYPVR